MSIQLSNARQQEVIAVLQAVRGEAPQLIALTKDLRSELGKYTQTREKMNTLFRNLPLWQKVAQANGHATFKHRISGVVVGWQDHGKNNDLNPGQAVEILDQVQDHLNLFRNTVFACSWKQTPDYKASAIRYEKWKKGLGN